MALTSFSVNYCDDESKSYYLMKSMEDRLLDCLIRLSSCVKTIIQ